MEYLYGMMLDAITASMQNRNVQKLGDMLRENPIGFARKMV